MGEVKLSPCQTMKAHGGFGARILILDTQPRHWEEIGWLVLRSATSTLRKIIPILIIYRKLDGSDQSEHEGLKKNLHTSDSRDRTRAVQVVAKHLGT